MRNKPKQPPKTPKAAPFFLPTVAGVELKFDTSGFKDDEGAEKVCNCIQDGCHEHVNLSLLQCLQLQQSVADFGSLSEFGQKVLSAQTGVQCECFTLFHLKGLPCCISIHCTSFGLCNAVEELIKYLRELGPSAIDSEIRCLAPEGGGSIEVMGQFIKCINHALKTKRDFEIVQAYLALFLKVSLNVSVEISCAVLWLLALLPGAWQYRSWGALTFWTDQGSAEITKYCMGRTSNSAQPKPVSCDLPEERCHLEISVIKSAFCVPFFWCIIKPGINCTWMQSIYKEIIEI